MEGPKIVCPVCGQNYLPAEIFFPDDLLGKPKEIIKTTSGKIDFYLGKEPDFVEEYICDNCNTKLKVKANLSFKVEAVPDKTDEEYVTTFHKPSKIILVEEEPLFD